MVEIFAKRTKFPKDLEGNQASALYDLSIGYTETKYIKLNTKTQNIFCFVNENLTTFLYTLNRGNKKTEGEKNQFSFLNCIPELNVIEKKLGFSI